MAAIFSLILVAVVPGTDKAAETGVSALAPIRSFASRVKGGILACFIRKGMTPDQVEKILGTPDLISGDSGGDVAYYLEYGIVAFYFRPYEVNTDGQLIGETKVTGVQFSFWP
jgi:hypothetical protein